MTRLPPALQPAWPAVKRAHRAGALVVGSASRATGGGRRGVPAAAATSSRDLTRLEPDSTRYHPLEPAHVVRRPMPDGAPWGHWFFSSALEQRVPERFVLDLDDGAVLGPHVAVTTRGGRLDLETSHYFDIGGWREHPVFLNPRPGTPVDLDGTLAVLATRATGANYFHFLVDALPRLGQLGAALPDVVPDAVLLDHSTRYHRELVALLGLDRFRIVEPRRGLALRARRLLVPSLPDVSTFVSPETTRWLGEHLPPKRDAGRPERLYVTRGTTRHTRRVEQEEELWAALRRRGFTRFDPGAHGVQEQIDHFAAARVVVAPHGAALTNLNFCRPGVRVLELFAPGYLNGGYWSIASNIAESRYRYLVADRGPQARPGRFMAGVMDDIDVGPAEVMAALDLLLEESP